MSCKKCKIEIPEGAKFCPNCGKPVPQEDKPKKKHKRGHGEGTIHQRSDGRWEAKLTAGWDPVKDKAKRVTYYGKTQREVREKLDQAKGEVRNGTFSEPSKMTLGEWLDRWLEVYAKPTLRVTTYESYEIYIRRHIKPALGKRPLKQLLPSDLQEMYNEKQTGGRADGKEGGLSNRTIRYIHFIIQSALRQAVKEGLLSRNPAEATAPPKHEKKEIQYLITEEIDSFLEVARGGRYFPALQLELGTGMRRGELLGLKWSDLDLKGKTATIRRSLVKTKSGPKFHDPKTETSIRTIKLPDEAVKELKALKERQAQEKWLIREAYQDNDLVFCQANGKLVGPRNFTRHFDMLLKRAGIRHVSFHSMRHTHATELLRMKIDLKTIQGRLGHADYSTTANTYAHLTDSLQQEAADKINDVLKGKKSPPEPKRKKKPRP